jgi:putative ABC transport system permease protein
MKTGDIIRTAVRNSVRSKLRTTLTVLAITIGAFTLTLTNALGAGINAYVTDTVASVGVDDVMTVFHTPEDQQGLDSGPALYDPDATTVGGDGMLSGMVALTGADLDAIAAVDGVLRVEPVTTVSVDYVQHADGDRFQLSLSTFRPGMHVELAAGEQVDLDAADPQIILPTSYVEPLGFADADAAVGTDVTVAVTDATGLQSSVTATVVGIAEPGIIGATGAVPNDALTTELADLAAVGLPAAMTDAHAAASVWFDPDAGTEATETLQSTLADAGFTAMTLDDQLGVITSVIDTIVLVLNGFAIIALIAASIGIINTLFMAVQERTREVGLMKAMGLSDSRVFSLFSVEAVVIGLFGSVIGVLAAMGVGSIIQSALASTVLADLPGLTLLAFEPATIAIVVVSVMVIAFLAGTLPALRAAKAHPIESLRYE